MKIRNQVATLALITVASLHVASCEAGAPGDAWREQDAEERGTTGVNPLQLAAQVGALRPRAEFGTSPSVAVGSIPAAFEVTPTGSARYTIPIELTPGRAGMTPEIALVYDSQHGNGLMGMGWTIDGLSTIAPCHEPEATRLIVGSHDQGGAELPDFERFCLDGRPLALDENNGMLGPIPDDFTRVRQDNLDNFTAYTKDGRVLEYDVQPRPNAGRGRLLSRIWDRSGNFIEIQYEPNVQVEGLNVPRRVLYTGWGPSPGGGKDCEDQGVCPLREVEFVYEPEGSNINPARLDPFSGAVGDVQGRIERLLREIRVYGPEHDLVRKYLLDYDLSTTRRSRLTSLRVCDQHDACQPATTFAWNGLSNLYDDVDTGVAWSGGFSTQGEQGGDGHFPDPVLHAKWRAAVVDLNGDGRDDLAHVKNGVWRFILAPEDGVFDPQEENSVPGMHAAVEETVVINNGFDAGESVVFSDAEGEGFRLGRTGDGGEFVFLHEYFGGDSDLTGRMLTLDLNADGLVDVAGCSGGVWRTFRNTGNGDASHAAEDDPFCPTSENASYNVLDIDSAGRQGLLAVWHVDDETHRRILTTRHAGFDPTEQLDIDIDVPDPFETEGDKFEAFAFDSNGDGTRDYLAVAYESFQESQQMAFASNVGGLYKAFGEGPNEDDDDDPVFPEGDMPVRVFAQGVPIDFDLDGADEVLFPWAEDWDFSNPSDPVQFQGVGLAVRDFGANTPDWRLTQNLPAGFTFNDDPYGQTGYRSGDFNGDGLPDLVSVSAETGTIHVHLRRIQDYRHWPDRILSIEDGYGALMTIDYLPMSDPEVYSGPGAECEAHDTNDPVLPGACIIDQRPLVRAHTVGRNDVFDTTDATRALYHYSDARFDRRRRQFLGYARVVSTQQARIGGGWVDGYTTLALFDDIYTEDLGRYPYAHRPSAEYIFAHDGVDQNQATVFGYLYAPAETGGEGSTLHQVRTTVRGQTDFEWNGAPVTVDEIESVVAGLDSFRSETTTYEDYDDFGNPRLVRTQFSDGSSFERETTYLNDTDDWTLGLPRTVRETNTVPNVGSESREHEIVYDELRRPQSRILEPNRPELKVVESYEYDDFGNVTGVVVDDDPPGGNGILVAYPDEDSRSVSFDYDAEEHLFPEVVRNSLGHTEITIWDRSLSVPVLRRDPNFLITTWQYDGFGREVSEVRPDGNSSATQYARVLNPGGQSPTPVRITQRTDGLGFRSVWFDRAVRPWRVQYGAPGDKTAVQQARYDVRGHLLELSKPAFGVPQFVGWHVWEYDNLGRVVRSKAAGRADVEYRYQVLETVMRSDDRRVALTTDIHSRVLFSRDAENTLVCYDYETFGRLRAIAHYGGIDGRQPRNCEESLDAAELTWRESDPYDRATYVFDPQAGERQYQYNAFGEPVAVADGKNQQRRLERDALGRLSRVETPEGVTTFQWDDTALGKIYSIEGPDGDTEYHYYDALGRPWFDFAEIGGDLFFNAFLYDQYSRIRTLFYPTPVGLSLFAVDYGYDDNGYVQSLRKTFGGDLVWERLDADPLGQPLRERFGNGVVTTRSYEPETFAIEEIQTFGMQDWQDLSYSYDQYGNLETRQDHLRAQSETFSYDSLNRLIRVETESDGEVDVTNVVYNRFGDIDSKSDLGGFTYAAEYTNPRALVSAGGRDFTYDANGNQVTRGTTSIQYNSINQPTEILTPNTTIRFRYSGRGEKIERIDEDQSVTTRYFDPFYELERGFNGPVATTLHKYKLYSDRRLVAHVTREPGFFPGTFTETTQYVHDDGIGSADTLTNAAGLVSAALSFDAFGGKRDPDNWVGPGVFSDLTGVNSGFTGHEERLDDGLIDMGGRRYDPRLGRFISPDPFVASLLFSQGLNRFSYALNNPLTFADPDGYCPIDSICADLSAPDASGATSGTWGLGGQGFIPLPPGLGFILFSLDALGLDIPGLEGDGGDGSQPAGPSTAVAHDAARGKTGSHASNSWSMAGTGVGGNAVGGAGTGPGAAEVMPRFLRPPFPRLGNGTPPGRAPNTDSSGDFLSGVEAFSRVAFNLNRVAPESPGAEARRAQTSEEVGERVVGALRNPNAGVKASLAVTEFWLFEAALGPVGEVVAARIFPLQAAKGSVTAARSPVARSVGAHATGAPFRVIQGTRGLQHSFDRHAAQWFGRSVSRGSDLPRWQALVERAAGSKHTVSWSTGTDATVGHLARIEGKYFFVQFYVGGPRAGELAAAFVPNQSQLGAILSLLR